MDVPGGASAVGAMHASLHAHMHACAPAHMRAYVDACTHAYTHLDQQPSAQTEPYPPLVRCLAEKVWPEARVPAHGRGTKMV